MDGRMMHDEEHLEKESNASDLSTEGLFRKLVNW